MKIHDLERLVNVSFALVYRKLIGETYVCGRFARVVALNRVRTGTMDNAMQTEGRHLPRITNSYRDGGTARG